MLPKTWRISKKSFQNVRFNRFLASRFNELINNNEIICDKNSISNNQSYNRLFNYSSSHLLNSSKSSSFQCFEIESNSFKHFSNSLNNSLNRSYHSSNRSNKSNRSNSLNRFYYSSNNSNSSYFNTRNGLILALSTYSVYELNKRKSLLFNDLKAKELDQDELAKQYGKFNKRFKTITIEELNKHNSKENGIWVSFREGVYDVTEFVNQHPGGEIIMMAAGNRLDSFWNIYANHKTKQTLDLLETFRVANIEMEKEDIKDKSDVYDPFENDPIRNPMLKVHTKKPFNAETPGILIGKDFLTPNEAFFVRNHLPVPEIAEEDYRLEITGLGLDKTYEFTLNDLKKLPQVDVICSIQCAGNRREELSKYGQVKGLPWQKGAISNAKWTGVYLVDLLKSINCDMSNKQIKHIICEGHDFDPTSKPYSASVQSEFALDPNNKVLIAYKMNDQKIPRDHGFPVRFIAPGVVGARNVKWLAKIVLSDEEADSHVQRGDYKSFTPDVTLSNVDFKKGYSIQQLPVQSAICEPDNNAKISIKQIKANQGRIKLSGYAWSGGKRIIRVDIAQSKKIGEDDNLIWKNAKLFSEEEYNKKVELDNKLRKNLIKIDEHKKQCEQLPNNEMRQDTFKSYSWVLWSIELEIDEKELKKGNKLEFICKAIDSSYNTQPESAKHIHNFRGVLNNSWHRVIIELV